jgi:hypothetical protein
MIGNQPFVAVFGQHRDAVADLHSKVDDRRGCVIRVSAILAPRHVMIQPVALEPECRSGAELARLFTMHRREVCSHRRTFSFADPPEPRLRSPAF